MGKMNEIWSFRSGSEIKYSKETARDTCMKHRGFLLNGSLYCWCCSSSTISAHSLMADQMGFLPPNIFKKWRSFLIRLSFYTLYCFFTRRHGSTFLLVTGRPPSAALSTVQTVVWIVGFASNLVTQSSWLGRSTLELHLWLVLHVFSKVIASPSLSILPSGLKNQTIRTAYSTNWPLETCIACTCVQVCAFHDLRTTMKWGGS